MKERPAKLDLIKINTLCSAIDAIKRVREQATDCEKIFTKRHYNKELSLKIYKVLLKSTIRKQSDLKYVKDFNRHFIKIYGW
jgi:hypothetical protein